MNKKASSPFSGQKYPYFKHDFELNKRLRSTLTTLNYACCIAIFEEYWANNCILSKKLSNFVSIFKPLLKIEKPRKNKLYKADTDPFRRKVKYILSIIVSTSEGAVTFSTDKKFLKIPHLDKQFYDLERLSNAHRIGANITNSKKFERLSLRTKKIFNGKWNSSNIV